MKVRGKIFAFIGMLDDDFRLGVKLTHSNAAVLALPFVNPMGYGMARSGWVTIKIEKGRKPPPMDLLRAWIDESYRAVAPKRLVAELKNPAGP